MADKIIQIEKKPHQKIEVFLDSSLYVLDIKYNESIDLYTMSILNAERQHMLSGIALVKNYSLLSVAVENRLSFPQGELLAISSSDLGKEHGYDDLGDSLLIAYREANA